MPVTVDDFLWENTGFVASGTSIVVSHPDAGGTTAGKTVVVIIYAASTTLTLPTGFASVGPTTITWACIKSNVGAGETSWTFTQNFSTAGAWYMVELDNVSLLEPYDGHGAISSGTVANGATKSSGTAPLNAGSSTVALAMFGAVKAAGGDVQSWSGYTNGFTERVDAEPAGVAGKQIAVAWKTIDGWGTYETTATFATTAAAPQTASLILLLRSADASINAPLVGFTGFEFGTHGGMGNASPNNPIGLASGTFGTGYSVAAGSARNGSYGFKLVASATTAVMDLAGFTGGTIAFGCNVKVESGSGTPTVLSFLVAGGSGTDFLVLYDVTNTKFGVQWVGGSVVWQSGTTALSTWVWIDIRATFNSSAWHLDWTLETGTDTYTAQTSPTDLTGQTPGTSSSIQLGQNATQTMTAHYDDPVWSKHYAAYPLGPHVVRLLVPETTGAAVSGTSTNFSKFTANGTLAAFAADVGANLDEVPPTVSASSDGLVQTAVAASDYVELPMTTYTLASDEIIAGVRFVAALWGGTGSGTGTLGWRGHDGLTETTFVAAGTSYDADSLTAISATYPLWNWAMWSGANSGAWTQTRLDAASVRMGFSTDATPDMGASAVYLEVAIKKAPTVRTLTIEDPISATADLIVNPYNSATVSYIITNNDTTQTAQFDYSISGTPQTPVSVGPSSSSTLQLNADAFGDISDIALTAS